MKQIKELVDEVVEDNKENVENTTNDDTIDIVNDGAVAEGRTSEDTTDNTELQAYKALYEKQQAELQNQIKENQSLQKQISLLIRNTSNVTSSSVESVEDTTSSIDETYVPLKDLGSEIGRRDYINT